MMSLVPSYLYLKVLSIIGAVRRKNAEDWVCMKRCITKHATTISIKMNSKLIPMVARSCPNGYAWIRGSTLSGKTKQIVKIRNAINSGNVSLILPL